MSKSLDAYWKWNVTWLTQKWEEVQMIFSEKEMCSQTHEKQPQSWGFFFFFFWAGGDNAQLGLKISVLSSCQNPEYFIKLLMELTSLLQWKTLEAGILYSKMAIRCSVMSDFLWPIDRSPSGSSVHGILQAGILEGVAVPPLGVFLILDGAHISCITCIAPAELYYAEDIGKRSHSPSGVWMGVLDTVIKEEKVRTQTCGNNLIWILKSEQVQKRNNFPYYVSFGIKKRFGFWCCSKKSCCIYLILPILFPIKELSFSDGEPFICSFIHSFSKH